MKSNLKIEVKITHVLITMSFDNLSVKIFMAVNRSCYTVDFCLPYSIITWISMISIRCVSGGNVALQTKLFVYFKI